MRVLDQKERKTQRHTIRMYKIEDHVWFEDRWMVASLCDE
jgi:hypothetical protein